MSAKIAVISSMTWLIGWMRPRSAGDWRTGSVTSTFSAASRAAIATSFSSALRAVSASVTRFFRPLMAGPLTWRSSGAHRAQRLQQFGDRALLAQRRDAHRLDRLLVGGRGDVGHQVEFRECPCPYSIVSRSTRSRAHRVGPKKNPRQPCQRGFPKSEFRKLGKALVRLQRFQKRSASCSSDIRARPSPWPPARRTPAARGSPCRTAPCGRSRCRPC